MKTSMIGNYTNKYPQNNNRQASASRPNFAMHIVRDGLVCANISHIAGAKNLQRILRALHDWSQDANMAARFRTVHHHDPKLAKLIQDFDPYKLPHWGTTDLTPQLSFKDGRYKAKIADNRRSKKCSGHGVSTKSDPAEAVIEAYLGALRDYARNRIFEDMV